MSSAAGLCFCFSMVPVLLSIGTRSTAYAATAFVFIFQIFLGIGWLPIPWFYPGKVTTTRIRSKEQALEAFVNWSYLGFLAFLLFPFINFYSRYFVINLLCSFHPTS